jgi:hypothetical protein
MWQRVRHHLPINMIKEETVVKERAMFEEQRGKQMGDKGEVAMEEEATISRGILEI